MLDVRPGRRRRGTIDVTSIRTGYETPPNLILCVLYHRFMAMISAAVTSPSEGAAVRPAACLFHALSDPSRLLILQHLTLGEHRVVDLTAHLGLAQSTVSKHLACLRDCGLVTSRPEGRASLFSLRHEAAVLELLAAAETLLGLTGDAVTLCPRLESSSEGES